MVGGERHEFPLSQLCIWYVYGHRGGFRIFRRGRGGGHTLIERAISYHFSQKGYHVRACTTGTRGHPRRAVPEQSGDETISESR